MTYQLNGAVRRIGVGDDDAGMGTIAKVLNAFLPKINEIQSQGDANAQQQVDALLKEATGGGASAPVTTTKSGGTSTISVGAGDFVNRSSVCKPSNFPALTAAKELQMQLNRIAKAKSIGTIVVDGDIGPATVGLVGRAATVGAKLSPAASCTSITGAITLYISGAKAFADSIGAPQPTATEVSNAAKSGSITVVSTTGGTLDFKPPGVQASIFDKVKSLPENVKIIAGGAAVLGGILLFKKMRRGRSSAPAALPALAAPTSNPARRRRRRRR